MNTSASDAFKIAGAVLFSVGGGAAIVTGLSSWLGKVWADRLMQDNIARHDQVLEKLRSDLDKTIHVHRVQFETEFKALSDIWVKLSAVRTSLAVSAPFFKAETEDERVRQLKELTQQFTQATNAFLKAVDDQSPFYPKPIYERLEAVISVLIEERRNVERCADNETGLEVWLDVNSVHCLKQVAALADEISELIRERIESLSIYRE